MEEYRKYEPIFGSWYLSRQIGKGSFGKVYEITREEYGTTYRSALKIISIPQDEDDVKTRLASGTEMESVTEYYKGILKEIVNENEIMAQLKGNSNIVSYEDHQIIRHEDGIGYDILIRMELLTPLLDRMMQKKLDEKEVVRLGIDMCKALELCHRKNIIHRDIKPQNIFISDNGDYKLGDFGIARTIEKTTGGMSKKGTDKYMAPEVYRGDNYDLTVDLYSLGIVLFSLLNGNRGPFLPAPPARVTHNDEEEARTRRMRGEPIPDPAEGGGLLAAIIRKACAFDPKDRYPSAEKMREDLESYLVNYGDEDYSERTIAQFPPGQGRTAPVYVPPVDNGIRAASPAFREPRMTPAAQTPRTIPPQRREKEKSKWPLIAGLAGLVVILLAVILVLLLRDPVKETAEQKPPGNEGKKTVEQKDPPEKPAAHPDDAVEYNGHYYKVFNDPMYWSEAKKECEDKGGYLATVTSEEECDFIAGLIEDNKEKKNYWLGGSDHENEGEWRWVTGESWTYSRWRVNQPDNRDTDTEDHDQDYLQMCCGSNDDDRYMLWWDVADSGYSEGWEDYPNYKDTQHTGYVCEWEN